MRIHEAKPGQPLRLVAVDEHYREHLDVSPYKHGVFYPISNGGTLARSCVHLPSGDVFGHLATICEWAPYPIAFGREYGDACPVNTDDLLALLLQINSVGFPVSSPGPLRLQLGSSHDPVCFQLLPYHGDGPTLVIDNDVLITER